MPWLPSDMIEVRRIKGKGRGVFARRDIAVGTVIEKVPMLVIPESDIHDATIADYAFEWSRGKVALALGYGSLYNHSYQPSAVYEDVGPQTKLFRALRDIAAGEEITINYNADPNDMTPMDFEVLS